MPVLFPWRQNTEIVLNQLSVVVGNIILNHLNQRFFRGKSPAIAMLPLEDPPEAFHGAVIHAVSYPGHTPSCAPPASGGTCGWYTENPGRCETTDGHQDLPPPLFGTSHTPVASPRDNCPNSHILPAFFLTSLGAFSFLDIQNALFFAFSVFSLFAWKGAYQRPIFFFSDFGKTPLTKAGMCGILWLVRAN